jgi:energy-coupling factor transporter ATP-binding protein EcfA2
LDSIGIGHKVKKYVVMAYEIIRYFYQKTISMQLNRMFFLIGILITVCACRSDFETVASKGDLVFSQDTIYLDTVFSTIGSSTFQLKVYNKSNEDISIPSIQLGKGLNSKYRMTVDGMSGNQGKLFENVTLLAKDSLYIFIETTVDAADANPTDFLYTDQIEFDSGVNLQKVALVTLVKDAIFLFPKRLPNGSKETIPVGNKNVEGFYLEDSQLRFTNQKAYVIYGYAGVTSGKTAIFDAGARVYFHSNSGLIVGNNASLQINGSQSSTSLLENEVIFQGDRLQSDYDNVPGQWETVWINEGAINNNINHLTIKNASIGLLIQNSNGSNTSIKNSQIYNSTHYGILAQNAKITAENLAINNAGKATLACEYGGNYSFTHCTFNNNWNSTNQVAVSLNNYKLGAVPETKALNKANFNNCIIYGAYSNELELSKKTTVAFEYQFNNCLIKFDSKSAAGNPLYQFTTDATRYNGIILNQDPKFQSSVKNKLNIDVTSPAVAKGNLNFLIPKDILGTIRTLPPDLGAYQNKPFVN